MKYLRDFISISKRFPNLYIAGDDTIQMPIPTAMQGVQPTKGYVECIANLNNEDSCDNPVLTVLVVKASWKNDVTHYPDKPQRIKFTDLLLVDGDGQKVHSRLNKNLVEIGCMLKRGDKICLDRFTIVHFRINEDSPRMPMLFIHELSRVGNEPIDDTSIKEEMIVSHHSTPTTDANAESSHGDSPPIDPRKDPKPQCTTEKRLCAIHGISFITCLCDAIPVTQLNLETVKADCYFATDDLDEMSPSHKRNMVYWWYATSVYSIVGKGNVGQLPQCLEYAIREKWPNENGEPYKGFKARKKAQPKKRTKH